MRILFIGGTGILSSDSVVEAVNQGHQVCLLNRGKSQPSKLKVETIIADVRDKENLDKVLDGQFFDVVIDYLSYSVEHLQSNLDVFVNKCKQYVFISSATVFEISGQELINEESKKGNKEWDYAYKKYQCEQVLKDFCDKNTQLVYTIVRPYVTYGDTRIPFAIIPQHQQWSLARRILEGKPIVMWDGGKAKCTITHTRDFAVGIIGLCGNSVAYNNHFNIVGDERLTWRDVLIKTGEALGKEPVIVDIPSEFVAKKLPKWKGQVLGDKGRDTLFDNKKIREAVPKFGSKITFSEGIKGTIENYRKNEKIRIVNYFWDGEMDYLINAYCKEKGNKKFKLKRISEKTTLKNKLLYWYGRLNWLQRK